MFNPALVVVECHEVHVFLHPDEALNFTEWLNRHEVGFTVLPWSQAVGSIDANGDPITYHKFERDALEGVGIHGKEIIIHEPIG